MMPPSPRALVALLVLIVALLAPAGARPGIAQEAAGVERGVFLLVVIGQEDSRWRSFGAGTAFFTEGGGTALTNSHVVWRAFREPARYQLLAIVDRVFFSARVVCASRLSQDPTQPAPGGVPLERDVAQIMVVAPDAPFAEWGITAPGGTFIPIAAKHDGPMPQFAPLTVGTDPRQNEAVRVVGFGRLAIPRRWSATGNVREMIRARDGTPVFTIAYERAAAPGHSGAPVVNAAGQVVGILAWGTIGDDALGLAIGASVLRDPCR
jgi:hypothetical protein